MTGVPEAAAHRWCARRVRRDVGPTARPADPQLAGRRGQGWSQRRRVRAVLGVLWVVAGLLQLQPFMFTRGFAQAVLGSAALSQPVPLGHVITLAEHIVAAHPVLWNWVFAVAELLIGAAMLASRNWRVARIACLCSISWGLGVWCIGEGLGGLFTGRAAPSTGAPGAAVLYVLLTVAAWPRRRADRSEAPVSARLIAVTWLVVWLSGALLAGLPAQRGAGGLREQALMGWMMSPSWATRPTLTLAKWLGGLTVVDAAVVSAVLVALQVAIGLGVLRSGRAGRCLVLCGTGLAAVFWVFGQGFGGLSTGDATDVGTGPLVVLLAAVVLATQAQGASLSWFGAPHRSRQR